MINHKYQRNEKKKIGENNKKYIDTFQNWWYDSFVSRRRTKNPLAVHGSERHSVIGERGIDS